MRIKRDQAKNEENKQSTKMLLCMVILSIQLRVHLTQYRSTFHMEKMLLHTTAGLIL